MAEKKNQVAKEPATDKTNAGNAERYRMRKQYAEEVVPALIKRFGYKNINEVPRLEKIVLNMGLGDCKDNSKEIRCKLQGERRYERRRKSYASRQQNVRLPRQVHFHRASSRPRLPRHFLKVV